MNSLRIVEDGLSVQIGEWRLDFDTDIALPDALALLDKTEQARAQTFKFDRDRDRFIRAHGQVRRLLGGYLGMAPAAVAIVGEEGAKPVVSGCDVSFSLSHSGGHAVMAMTRDGDVGVDLETLDRSDGLEAEMDGMARMCLTEEEQGALKATPAWQKTQRFLTYWTAKEARMKLIGEGMALEPHTIVLELRDGLPVGYRHPRPPTADLQFIPMARPDAICCLAVRRGGDHAFAHIDRSELEWAR
jgi:4'-phosphopantetheinyl transferase